MDEHKKFLADRLLSDERPITYRLLSRALDVHVNTAKEMLYDFHNYQNARKANSVHATYLVYGTKGPEIEQPDGDVEMSGSMHEESFSEEAPISTLTLAREEELNDVLAAYQQVVSIHVYSLAPHPQKDLSLLSDLTAQLSEYSSNGDITMASKKYGVISNPRAQKRERKGLPQAYAAAPSQTAKKEPHASKTAATATVKQETSTAQPETKQTKSAKEEAPSSKEGTPAPSGAKKPAPSLKRGASGGIMQSFAKAAARAPKPKPASKNEEDSAMVLSDDGEADDSDIIASTSKSKPAADSADIKRKRQEREEALRKMMEDDDDEEEEENEDSDKESEQADEEMEEAPEPEPEPEPEAKKEEEPTETISSTGDGRRRGRRRVMKKKRILDDQGYMVTIQEPGWESFSEDEAPPPAKKAAPTPTPSSSSGSKAKKPAPKGQGNIMSFFSKK
ncbi:DNA polymerase delta subunit 3 [Fusarium austroafricanum]|uniref:DNA polymerase delta subunit 3 n=1 Tax=Fusarium austroafricanum TaxID=2364996 RepID=A0A8H4NQV4_9HYPO|nr:DNA polymerase delta subunit 3 [Fusarium austroafricanum]